MVQAACSIVPKVSFFGLLPNLPNFFLKKKKFGPENFPADRRLSRFPPLLFEQAACQKPLGKVLGPQGHPFMIAT